MMDLRAQDVSAFSGPEFIDSILTMFLFGFVLQQGILVELNIVDLYHLSLRVA